MTVYLGAVVAVLGAVGAVAVSDEPASGEEDVWAVVTMRPVLDLPESILLGYIALDQEERRFTKHALDQHGAMVAHWYRLLTLFRLAFVFVPSDPDKRPSSTDRLLRLQFIAAAGGTIKLVLDATLAGYYTQAFALIRHLFETWVRLEYLHIRPDMAHRWYVGEDGSPPQPPKRGSIHKEVLAGVGKARKPLVERVFGTIDELNSMAHPSPHTFQQTVGIRPNQYFVGANYDPGLCVRALHEGASGLMFLLVALNRDIPQGKEWLETVRGLESDYETVLAMEVAAAEARCATQGSEAIEEP